MAWEDDLAVLARERGPALVGYAYLLTGDLHRAQDLVQEGLARTFSRRRTSDVEWLEAYVRRAVLHAYLDEHRRDTRRRQAPPAPASPTVHPDDVAVGRADVHQALAALSPRERACVVLRHFEDLTVPEVAARLGLQEGSVKRYLSDARARLAPLLTADEPAHVQVIPNRRDHR